MARTFAKGVDRRIRRFHSPIAALVLLGMTLAVVFLHTEASGTEAKFIGVKACGKCHKKVKDGEQLAVWKKSKHANAFRTLASEKAREKAGELKISGNPQKAEACLVCHTTGFGEPAARFSRKFKIQQGVQCESCHGAGSLYRKKKIMKAITKERGPDRENESPTAKETGLIIPDEASCKTCHVKQLKRGGKVFVNPNYKDFDFKKRADKIKHPIPR